MRTVKSKATLVAKRLLLVMKFLRIKEESWLSFAKGKSVASGFQMS